MLTFRSRYIRDAVILLAGVQAAFVVQIVHAVSRSRFDVHTARHKCAEIVIAGSLSAAGLAILYARKTINRSEAIQSISILFLLSVPPIAFCLYHGTR